MTNGSRSAVLGVGIVLAMAGCAVAPGPGIDPGVVDPGASASGAGGASSTGGTGLGGAGGSVGGSGGAGPDTPGAFTPSPSRLRRLTKLEYTNSVVDLLGPGTEVTTAIEEDAVYNNLTTIAAASVSLTAPVTEQFETSAHALAEALVKDPARRAQVVSCTPSGASDEACMTAFVTDFGRKVFRRPLAAQEVAVYAGLGNNAATTLSDFWGGVQYALAGLLQSPNFLYRTEFGVSVPAAPGRALNSYELASRLSYLLWSTTPDETLLAAAADDSLQSPEVLQQQAERLLASPRAEAAIVHLLSEMLRLYEVDGIAPDAELFPAAESPTLGASFRAETQHVLRDLFSRDADYREFFTSNETYVNAELAALYGVDGPSGMEFEKVTLPETGPRAGFLGQGSFLALNAQRDHTSPTLRGVAIVTGIMCNSIPPPPEGVVTELAEKDKSKTMRDQLAVHQEEPICASCHAVMDPMGLALEHFDAVAAYRETDRGMSLDVTGTVNNVTFDGLRQLGQVLASEVKTNSGTPETSDCLIRNLFRAATGHVETPGERQVVDALSTAFVNDGFRIKGALSRLVTSDAFRFIGQPE